MVILTNTHVLHVLNLWSQAVFCVPGWQPVNIVSHLVKQTTEIANIPTSPYKLQRPKSDHAGIT